MDFKDWRCLEEKVKSCKRCPLSLSVKNIVLGEGPIPATVMLVGEAPGAVEDEVGRPFVGPAGEILNRLLAASGLKRETLYITNVVKCRPPGNREPRPEEIQACLPYLKAQIGFIRPHIIVCLGSVAARTLIDPEARITQIRGKIFCRAGIYFLPTFHPAALLRDGGKKLLALKDFKKLKALWDKLEKDLSSGVS